MSVIEKTMSAIKNVTHLRVELLITLKVYGFNL